MLLCRLALTRMSYSPLHVYLGNFYLPVRIQFSFHYLQELECDHDYECGGLQTQADLGLNLYSFSLNLSFLIFKMEVITPNLQHC